MALSKDLKEFIELLNAEGVEYVVIGGYAVAFHGYPRYTGDLDLLLRVGPQNAERIIRALRRFGFADPNLTATDFCRPGVIVQLGVPPNRIDLVTQIDGVEFEEAWRERVPTSMAGIPTFMISRAHLIANKRATGRARDLADVDELGLQPE